MRRGPLFMAIAALSFTLMLALVKVARQELSTLDVVFWRSLSAVPLSLAIALAGSRHWSPEGRLPSGRRAGLRIHNRRVFLLRCLFGFAGMFGYFTAARAMPVADLTLVTRLQPVAIAVMAPLALGSNERPERSTWVVLAIGMLGCGIMLAPDLSLGILAGLWAVGGMLGSAAAHVSLRALGPTESPFAVVLWFQFTVSVLALVVIVAATGSLPVVPAAGMWPAVLGVGVLATAGQVLMTRAYAVDRASVVAAADYTAPAWGILVDILAFRSWPSWHALAGGSLVVGAGLWLVTRPEVSPITSPISSTPPGPHNG